ncbi:MAG: hypothetical protein FJ189_03605 [Gammaproteobacteria bacterium]|nr:hypothetical protein [Gammaproteobacteria bacterium]
MRGLTPGLLALACLLGGPVGVAAAPPTPMPLPKQGACPPGYSPSGAYCVPGRQGRYALPKQGACPAGYFPSSNYCVATAQGRLAVPKVGACPPGYFPSGAYCVQSRSDGKSGLP